MFAIDSLNDYGEMVRVLHFMVLYCIGPLLITLVINWIVLKIIDDDDLTQSVQWIQNDIVALIVFLAACSALQALIINQTPRAVIDRSDVNQQQEQYEHRLNQFTPSNR